jgi:uncharacterized membrane protein SpoIIM required for sporulation
MTAPTPTITLKSAEFRKGREAGWRELERLLDRVARRGIKSLDPQELVRLPLLYRTALSSLSVARAIALDRYLLLYLEDLAVRAYLVVYGPRAGLLDSLRRFLATEFPAAVRAVRWHILLSLLAIVAGAVAGFMLTESDETWFSTFIPSGLAGGRGPSSTREELLTEELFVPFPGWAETLLVFANFLFQHNTMVGVFCFSLGIAAGLPTLLLLVYQGLGFGAFLALHYNRGLTWEVAGWLSIHGITEFSAIILCGAGGLLIGEKILFPGRYSRVESLAQSGIVAGRVAVGAMLMFFVAAILEGVFRQFVQSTELRLTIGIWVGIAWATYFARGARVRPA